jgi:hypothetical protein
MLAIHFSRRILLEKEDCEWLNKWLVTNKEKKGQRSGHKER